nr:RNA-directed DNA polymerase, eukaryota [Tanacetum cinerariifolium]
MDNNIDALYNILKQNQGDVNDALGYMKKAVVVTTDPLALIAEKTKVSKQKEKVVVSSDSKGSDFEKIDFPFQQTSSLKPYVPNVILEKIIIDLEDEVVNLLEKEKVNLETIESLKSKGFKSSENVSSESENQSENNCLVVEKECDKDENPKVIAPGMFKLNVSQGEYSQWRERFMNYLEEQTDGEAMINSIQNVINDLKKCGYKKDNYELNYKFLNNLQLEWKQYGTLMRQTKNLMDINIDALYNILKQNQGDVNDALGYMKKAVVVTKDPLALIAEKTKLSKRKEKSANKKQEFVKSDDTKVKKKDDEKKRDMSKVKCYNCKKEGHFAKDYKKAKVKDYNYYKTKMLLAKKDSDEQVLLAEDQAWMESSSDSNQEINANMVFMAQI